MQKKLSIISMFMLISISCIAMQTPEKQAKRQLFEEEGYSTEPSTPSPKKTKAKQQRKPESVQVRFIANLTNAGAQIVYPEGKGINYKILAAARNGDKSILNQPITLVNNDQISISVLNTIFKITVANDFRSMQVVIYDPLHNLYANAKTFSLPYEAFEIKIKEVQQGPFKGEPYIEVLS